jgi:hypothetical protein
MPKMYIYPINEAINCFDPGCTRIWRRGKAGDGRWVRMKAETMTAIGCYCAPHLEARESRGWTVGSDEGGNNDS